MCGCIDHECRNRLEETPAALPLQLQMGSACSPVIHYALLWRGVLQVIDERSLVLMIPQMEPEENPAIGITFNCK